MSRNFSEKIDTPVSSDTSEKKYTSQEIIKGFSCFPDFISNGSKTGIDNFTKHWLWNSLILCQHYIYTVKNLSISEIRQILTLELSENGLKDQEREAYVWLKEAINTRPEVNELIESLLHFLQNNQQFYLSGNSGSKKKLSDYVGFFSSTFYVMASAALSVLFLPSILNVGLVFSGLLILGFVLKRLFSKKKKENFQKTVKSKIIEIDNIEANDESKNILNLMANANSAKFGRYSELNDLFNKLKNATKRFTALHQKNPSNWEMYFQIEKIWSTSIPSITEYDFDEAETRVYVKGVLEKILFVVNRDVQSLLKSELNGLKVEHAHWSGIAEDKKNADSDLGV